MRCIAVIIASVLVLIAALPTGAAVTASANPVGAAIVYSYVYANTEEPGDKITGFHVYAPVDLSLVTAVSADVGWVFHTAPDISGALDIYWDTEFPSVYGLAGGSELHVSFSTPATVTTRYDYVLLDFEIGNWGYDTEMTGGAWTMFGSVPVPEGIVPEPASLAVLAAGCLAAWMKRRR